MLLRTPVVHQHVLQAEGPSDVVMDPVVEVELFGEIGRKMHHHPMDLLGVVHEKEVWVLGTLDAMVGHPRSQLRAGLGQHLPWVFELVLIRGNVGS